MCSWMYVCTYVCVDTLTHIDLHIHVYIYIDVHESYLGLPSRKHSSIEGRAAARGAQPIGSAPQALRETPLALLQLRLQEGITYRILVGFSDLK